MLEFASPSLAVLLGYVVLGYVVLGITCFSSALIIAPLLSWI